MRKRKHSFLIHFEYFWLVVFIRLIDWLPIETAYSLSAFFAKVVYYLDVKHRKRTIQHMLHARVVSTREEAVKLAKKNFKSLGRMAVDVFKTNRAITGENVAQHVRVVATPLALETCILSKNPIIALSAHLGDFVFVATAYAMLSKHKILSVIRPYDNPKIEEVIQKIQFKNGHRSCHQQGALKPLLKALRTDCSIGLVVDQHAGGGAGVECRFFGQPARVHSAPALLHLKTGRPICVAVLRQAPEPGHFELVIKDPITMKPGPNHEEDVRELTQRYTTAIEELIGETPEQWFWAHRRWININRKK